MKRVLFIDRDGTLVNEPEPDFQLDSLGKLTYLPGVFHYLSLIAETLDYELVMVTNQDGLGTASFPEDTFWPVQLKIIEAFRNEGVLFQAVYIDRSLPEEQKETRKPGTGMLKQYMDGNYDLGSSFVIGDRITDMQLAENLGAKGIFFAAKENTGYAENIQVLQTDCWKEIYEYLAFGLRCATVQRSTKETEIMIRINPDGKGTCAINTGIPFFNHMLEQIAKHGMIDLEIMVKGDLKIDEHHTIEDTGIVLGTAFHKALGNKHGIQRYGFNLPMDDCLAQVAIDFGGRSWLVWDAEFRREMIGQMPTEMFSHFFKSFSDGAQCNLNIKAEGFNEHHKIEAIFKAFAKALKMAVRRDLNNMSLPSTKGVL